MVSWTQDCGLGLTTAPAFLWQKSHPPALLLYDTCLAQESLRLAFSAMEISLAGSWPAPMLEAHSSIHSCNMC